MRTARVEHRKRLLERIKLHEASHATVAACVGIPFEQVDVDAYRGGGHVISNFGKAAAVDKLAMVFAGTLGEQRAFGNADFGYGDREIADEIVRTATSTKEAAEHLIAQAHIKAANLLERFWPAVLDLSARLDPLRTMPGIEAEGIIRAAMPVPSVRSRVGAMSVNKPARGMMTVLLNGEAIGEVRRDGSKFAAYRGRKFIGTFGDMQTAARTI
jgi:hypothetical protein